MTTEEAELEAKLIEFYRHHDPSHRALTEPGAAAALARTSAHACTHTRARARMCTVIQEDTSRIRANYSRRCARHACTHVRTYARTHARTHARTQKYGEALPPTVIEVELDRSRLTRQYPQAAGKASARLAAAAAEKENQSN